MSAVSSRDEGTSEGEATASPTVETGLRLDKSAGSAGSGSTHTADPSDDLDCGFDARGEGGQQEAVSLYVLAISGTVADGLCSGPSRRGTRDSTVDDDGEGEGEGWYA